jgi:hypothetical protein
MEAAVRTRIGDLAQLLPRRLGIVVAAALMI